MIELGEDFVSKKEFEEEFPKEDKRAAEEDEIVEKLAREAIKESKGFSAFPSFWSEIGILCVEESSIKKGVWVRNFNLYRRKYPWC